MDDILKQVAEKLRGPPLHKNYSLVALDELSIGQIFKLIKQILGPGAVGEDIKTTGDYARILSLLKFPGANDLMEHEDKTVWFHGLLFILEDIDRHQTRLYLARFLGPINIPNDLSFDQNIQRNLMELRDIQARFKETHKNVVSMREENVNLAPKELRSEVLDLNKEKLQLKEKIKRFKEKAAAYDSERFNAMLKVARDLRETQEEGQNLKSKYEEQKDQLINLERREKETALEVRQLKEIFEQNGRGETKIDASELGLRILDLFEGKIASYEAQKKLIAADLNTTTQKLEKTTKNDTIVRTQQDCDRLQLRLDQIKKEHERLLQETNQNVSSNSSLAIQLKVFRQQHNVLGTTLEKKRVELEKKTQEATKLREEVDGLNTKLLEVKKHSAKNGMKKEEFMIYAAQLREKTKLFNEQKEILQHVTNEVVILSQTEHKLKLQCQDIHAAEERLKGADELLTNSQLNREMSREELRREIKNLALKIFEMHKELEPIRKQVELKEIDLKKVSYEKNERQIVFDNIAQGFVTLKAELEAQCNKTFLELKDLQAKSFKLSIEKKILEKREILIKKEEEMKFEPTNEKSFSTKELLQDKLAQLEILSKELRKTERALKESSQDDVLQMRMFTDIYELLKIKRECNQQMLSAQEGIRGTKNVLTL